MSQKSLARELSKLKVFDSAKIQLEQYSTDPDIAAEVLWNAYMSGDIEGKTIADLGCGTGILGIGCLLLGAKKVSFVDIDSQVLKILKENLIDFTHYEIINSDIDNISLKVDTVIQNPPFGTRDKHADRKFLVKAFDIAEVIYSFHKIESKTFIEKLSRDNNYSMTHYWEFDFPLKASMKFHKKKVEIVKVGCWRLIRKDS